MARLEDIPEPTRTAVRDIACPQFDTTPWVGGPPLAIRRVAIVSSAALIGAGHAPFPVGSGEAREVPLDRGPGALLTSHVSINFDRSGFQRDPNVVFPLERLDELAKAGLIGSVAARHFTVMGSTDPVAMQEAVAVMAQALHADKVDAVLLAPV